MPIFVYQNQKLHLIKTIGWIAIGIIYFAVGIIWYWGVANEFAVIAALLWWALFRQLSRTKDRTCAKADSTSA